MTPRCSRMYLDADAHKNKSAGEFRFVCVFLAENMTYLDSRGGDNKCRYADKRSGSQMLTLRKASVIPTASASMLVAIAEDEHLCEFQLVAVVACGVALNISFLKLSMNILPPRMRRSTKATQWS